MHAIFNELEQVIVKNLKEGVSLEDVVSAMHVLKIKVEHSINIHLNAVVMQQQQKAANEEKPLIVA